MDRILKLQPQAKLEFLPLDLKDLKQVETAAASFIASHPSLHVLINNAGIMACPFELTKDGIESQIATNHVGHFVLTMKLLGLLETSAPARIVNVSSMAHQAARKDLKWSTDYINDPSHSVWEKYGASKIANIYFSQTLGDKLRSKKITVNAAHPGWVDTELKRGPFDSYGNWFRPVLNSLNFMFAMKPAKGGKV